MAIIISNNAYPPSKTLRLRRETGRVARCESPVPKDARPGASGAPPGRVQGRDLRILMLLRKRQLHGLMVGLILNFYSRTRDLDASVATGK